jgi:hypothetical protein
MAHVADHLSVGELQAGYRRSGEATLARRYQVIWLLALRGCDLVALRVRDVFSAGRVKERTSIVQKRTSRPVRFEITEMTRRSLDRWIAEPEMRGADRLWPSRFRNSPHLSTRRKYTRRPATSERSSFSSATRRWTVRSAISASTSTTRLRSRKRSISDCEVSPTGAPPQRTPPSAPGAMAEVG